MEIVIYAVAALLALVLARLLGGRLSFRSAFGIFPPPKWLKRARARAEKVIGRELQRKANVIKNKYITYIGWSILFQMKLSDDLYRSRIEHIIGNDEDFVKKFSEFYSAYKMAARAGFNVKKERDYFGLSPDLFS